ncbi:bifunctional phosphoribosyl-AMP cyclohydrolase/phosphoribosyl-ATP diphosphatase HisIE [Eubacteriales bacterium OttesenSCG-928-M02]|nr:bifunctional phosphoribosyl-AMP cyclohydrolase/phosphoribosyl-ATP diphosphatase HisIE [Eubacteriales bacterium OttesenSCG-928-M02]
MQEANTGLLAQITYDDRGLVPVVTQDAVSGRVLMQAYMSRESLQLTLEKGVMVYYSRSRQELWEKGATSGHTQRLVSLSLDCDGDCLLARVHQTGAACHTGEYSCFYRDIAVAEEVTDAGILLELEGVIRDRYENPQEDSYTCYLFREGIDKILKKVGEESAETIIAAKNADGDEIRYETADLFYHLLVMLKDRGVPLSEVLAELGKRR